jgi:hypothetical protein
MTASSDLSGCLFNSGYSRLEAFSTTISQFYDDKICWALASKKKVDELALRNDGGAIVTIGENEISMDIPLMLTNLVSFFKDIRLKYNDGRGTPDIVTFLGADFVEDMQIKYQINLSNGSVILVDPEILNLITNPNIASIPQTSEDYCLDCKNIEPSQLEHILSPQSLSPLQEEMMSHHCCLHHTLFPKLITMEEKGEIPKCLAALKDRCPICVACLFGQAHKRPWLSKSKQKHPICKPTEDAPGKKASLDQMVSAQPGLILQMSGHLTNLCIMAVTIFVDHFSDFVYLCHRPCYLVGYFSDYR